MPTLDFKENFFHEVYFYLRKRGKTINEIVMKTMDRQLQNLENEMGRLKRRRAKLISLLDPPIPHLEPVKTSLDVTSNAHESVQSRVSIETPKSSEKVLPKLKEEPSSPIFFIGNNQSDDDVMNWRDFVDDVEIPQVGLLFRFLWPQNVDKNWCVFWNHSCCFEINKTIFVLPKFFLEMGKNLRSSDILVRFSIV